MNTEKSFHLCGCSKCKHTLKESTITDTTLQTTTSVYKNTQLYPDNKMVSSYWQEITYTDNDFENAILWGTKWTNLPSNKLTYTINLGGATDVFIPGIGSVGLVRVSQTIIDSVNIMMNDLTTFTNLQVQNVGSNVENAFISINFLDADTNTFNFLGIAMPPVNKNDVYYPIESLYTNLTDSFWASGNTYMSYKSSTEASYAKGGFWYDVMLHELGHSLGLAHPHDIGGNSIIMAGVASAFGDYTANLQPITCMSYNDTQSPILQETINGLTTGYMGTFGPLDIQALQYMYGVNPNFNNGNTTYTLSNNTGNKYWSSIYDTGGIDTIDASQSDSNTIIDIQNSTLQNNTNYAGVKFSYINFGGITITKSSGTIENVIGSAYDDIIIGNNDNNEFDLSGSGNDTVDGKYGMDTVILTNMRYSDITFQLNSDTGVIRITNNNTLDKIHLVNIEKIIFSDKEILIANDIIEMGSTQLNNTPITITLKSHFINPVVCCGDPTLFGRDPCTVRITNIFSNAFTMFLQESPERDGKHTYEKVSWIVGERGTWMIDNEKQVVFDNYNSNKTTRNGFVKNTFTKPFQSMPIVISQVASFKGRDFVLTRTKNINQTSFQCSMQEAEILDNLHTKERIDWCAFSSGTYRFNGKKFECGIVKNVNHNSKTVSFTKDFFTKQPNLLTRCSTYNGSDPANTRIEQTLSLSFNVRIQEETSRDAETKHVNENVSYIAVEEE